MKFPLVVGAAVLLSLGALNCVADEPALMPQLSDPGINIPPDVVVRLDKPILADDLSAKQRLEKLEAIAGATTWDRFIRKSVVAPVKIKLEYLKDDADQRIGHLIRVVFVVHVDLDTLKDKDLMQQMFGKPDADAPESESESESPIEFTADQLKTYGVEASENSVFGKIKVPLMNRVLARGVLQVQQTTSDDAITLAFQLDPRFNRAATETGGEILNAWTPTDRDGEPTSDEWTPYEGFAGYFSVHRLTEVPGACLIEARAVVHEPTHWFSGSNLLRSKLPILIQESARSFRRRLK